MPIEVKQITNSIFTSCSYVITHGAGARNAWIVDCGDVGPLVNALKGTQPKGILLTHGHFDHIYGLNSFCELFPEVNVYCSEWCKKQLLDEKLNLSKYHEKPMVFGCPEQIIVVEDGDIIKFAENVIIKTVATPGHTPGDICWIIDNGIFTGDSYIPNHKVVTNLPYGNKLLTQQSLEKILHLCNGRIIYPGHII